MCMAVNGNGGAATHFGRQMKKERLAHGWSLRGDGRANAASTTAPCHGSRTSTRRRRRTWPAACDRCLSRAPGLVRGLARREAATWSEVPPGFKGTGAEHEDTGHRRPRLVALHHHRAGPDRGLRPRTAPNLPRGHTRRSSPPAWPARMERQQRPLSPRVQAPFMVHHRPARPVPPTSALPRSWPPRCSSWPRSRPLPSATVPGPARRGRPPRQRQPGSFIVTDDAVLCRARRRRVRLHRRANRYLAGSTLRYPSRRELPRVGSQARIGRLDRLWTRGAKATTSGSNGGACVETAATTARSSSATPPAATAQPSPSPPGPGKTSPPPSAKPCPRRTPQATGIRPARGFRRHRP